MAQLVHDGVRPPGILVRANVDWQLHDVQGPKLVHNRERVQAVEGFLVCARQQYGKRMERQVAALRHHLFHEPYARARGHHGNT